MSQFLRSLSFIIKLLITSKICVITLYIADVLTTRQCLSNNILASYNWFKSLFIKCLMQLFNVYKYLYNFLGIYCCLSGWIHLVFNKIAFFILQQPCFKQATSITSELFNYCMQIRHYLNNIIDISLGERYSSI